MSEIHKTLEQRGVADEISATWRFLEKAYIPDARKTASVVIQARQAMSDFNELFSSFTEHMKVKKYALPTMDSYGRGLRTFLEHLTAIGITDVKRVTRDVLYDYQAK